MFYIYGIHAALAALSNQQQLPSKILVLKNRHDQRIQEIITLAKQKKIPLAETDKEEFKSLVGEAKHQGVIAIVKEMPSLDETNLFALLKQLHSPALLLVIDSIQDPHNLGACLRCADAAGAHAVISTKDRSVSLTPTVLKVASGATVPFVQVTNLARTLEQLKAQGVWIVGADCDTEQSLYETDLTDSIAIVVGAEGSGLRRLTKDKCDYLAKIPMHGSVASLNVSVSAGIFLFEAMRQRMVNYEL